MDNNITSSEMNTLRLGLLFGDITGFGGEIYRRLCIERDNLLQAGFIQRNKSTCLWEITEEGEKALEDFFPKRSK